MIVSFDKFNTLEPPQLTLCNPHCTRKETGELTAAVGVIANPSDLEVVDNFNSLSELNFTVTKGGGTADEVYSKLANRRTVFAEGMGFFVINSVEENESPDGIYKSVGCVSCEAELQNRMIPYFEDGEYTLPQVTDRISGVVTNWQFMAYASTAPIAITKKRYFEDADTETDVLSYLIDTLQETFGVLFIFDTINRKIITYDQSGYTQPSAVQISARDVLESVEIKENSEDIYTCLNVVGGNDLNILAVNPIGTNRIYNFAHYKSWMSSSLLSAVETWEGMVEAQLIAESDPLQLSTPAGVEYHNGEYCVHWSNSGVDTYTPIDEVKYPKLSQLYYQIYDTRNNVQWDLDNAQGLRDLYAKCSQNVAAETPRADSDVGYTVSTYNDVVGESNTTTIPVSADAVSALEAKLTELIATATTQELAAAYTQCLQNVQSTPTDGNAIQSALNICNDTVAPMGGETVSIAVQIEALQNNLTAQISAQDEKIAQYSGQISGEHALDAKLRALSAQMTEISESLAFSNEDVFSLDQQRELESYIFQATYTEENITVTDSMTNEEMFEQSLSLYNDAVDELSLICHPSQEFSVDAKFFVGLIDYAEVTPRIEVGRYLISVELYDGEIADLFLTAMSVNYTDRSLSFTFGNRYNKYDNRTLYGDLFSNITKTAAAIQNLQAATYPVTHGELTALTTAIRDARNVTKVAAIAADNQTFDLDDTGYTARRGIGGGAFSPEQLKIVNNSIVITRDNWQSAVAAIGKMVIGEAVTYGINAEAIVGELIVGDMLAINVDGKDLETYIQNLQSGISDAAVYQQYMTFDPVNGLKIQQTKDETSDGTYSFYTIQKGDGYYFYRSSNEETPFMSITSVDGRMHVNIAEISDRLSIGSEEYGGCFDFIATDAGLAIKWRDLGTTSS